MGIIEVGIISIGLAMDAFAVAICKGLSMKTMNWKKAGIIASYFGIFQAVMPLIGYAIGSHFITLVENVDHWIAFGLLGIIGIHMIKDAYAETEKQDDSIDCKTMTMLAIATSIDALAVGITFSLLKLNIINIIIVIGLITTILTFIGTIIGKKLGNKINKKAKIIGGFILIIIGLKILIEHLT